MKTWGDIFRAALRRGDDHGYAAYLADAYVKRKETHMRQVNDTVFVVVDNFGSEGVIIEIRKEDGSPPSHYKVRTAHDEFWVFDFEIRDAESKGEA